jgi:hypothetical protein
MKNFIKIKDNKKNKTICKIKVFKIIEWINKYKNIDINEWKLFGNDCIIFQWEKVSKYNSLNQEVYTIIKNHFYN